MNSFTRGEIYEFENRKTGEILKGKWTGDIEWYGETAMLKLQDLEEDGKYYFAKDVILKNAEKDL